MNEILKKSEIRLKRSYHNNTLKIKFHFKTLLLPNFTLMPHFLSIHSLIGTSINFILRPFFVDISLIMLIIFFYYFTSISLLRFIRWALNVLKHNVLLRRLIEDWVWVEGRKEKFNQHYNKKVSRDSQNISSVLLSFFAQFFSIL